MNYQLERDKALAKSCSEVLLPYALMLAAYFVVNCFAWPYAINTWISRSGGTGGVFWWQGGLLGFVPLVGQLGIPAAVVTWVAGFFI